MNSRPKSPKYARNKNVVVIGGSGSGKTRFFVKPNLMQLHSSYVLTDPKGTVLIECGKLLQRAGYRIKVLNTINFRKSMHYNPFVYIRSEKDVLKVVNTLIVNTKGEGEKSAEDFWVKAERLLYCALIGYIWYEAPAEEMNFTTLLELINASEAREDDEEYQSPVDLLFADLEERSPDHFAVKQYKKYKLAAGKTAKSILISCGARLAPFDIEELRELMSYDELELDTLGDRKTALFLIMSDTDDTFNFVIAILQSQLFNLLCDKADDEYNGKLPVHVRFLLDEFANIGQIPRFDKLIATIRSREMSASIILQSQKMCIRDSNEGNENNRHGGNENGNERGRREGDGGEGGNPGGLLSRLGVFGASALSTVTTGGLITTALGAVSAMGDYFDAMNAEDEKESRDNIIQGTTKLGMIGTGAGLGLVLGSVVPGIGNLAGAAIGAGIGSVAALMQGGSLGQRISDMIDGTAPMKKFQEEVKAAGEALDKAYEKAQNFVSIDKEVNDLIYDYKVLRDRSEELSSSQNPQDIQEAADAHERMKDIIRQIATIYPDLISQYETENGLLENKIDLIDQVSARNKNLAVLEMQQKAMDVQENLPQMMEDFKQKREAKEAKEASLSKVESAYHDQEWMDSLGKKSAGYIEAYDAHRKYISEHGKINKELQDEAIKRLKDLESHYGQKGVQDALVNNAGELSFDKAYQIAQGDQYAPINESYQVLNQDTITAIKNYDAAYAEIKNAIDTLTESVIISYEAKTGRSLEEDAGKYYELGEVEQKAMQGTLEQINAINQSFANIPEFVPVEFSIRVKDESGALNQISSMELFGADKGPGLTADFGSVSGAMNGYQSVSSIIKEYEKKSGMSFKEAAVNLQELDEAGQKAFMETIDKIKEVIEYLGYIPDTVPIDIVVSLKDESGIIKKKNLSDILTNTLSGLLPQKHATGGILTRPHLGLVAEEGPEAIIPLSPSKRHRGLELWQQTGAMLGMNPMAQRKMRDTKNNNVVSILTHLKDRESVFNRVNGYQTGSYSQGIDLWPGGEQPNIQAHADGGIFGEANESFTPGEEEGNEPTVAAKLDNRQAINITIHVSANPAFTIEAGENEGKIVLALKAHVREMVDDIGDELAERLGGIFANMPLKGA